MATIGNYGEVIVFGVFDPYNDWGAQRLVRPEEINRKTSARWAEYPLIKEKPLLEFQGTGLDEFNMEIILSADYGVSPAAMIDTIRSHIQQGIAEPLVIGGRQIGDNPYVIEEMSESWDEIWNEGQLFKATVSLRFKEYVKLEALEIKAESEPNSKKKKKKKKSKKKGSKKK